MLRLSVPCDGPLRAVASELAGHVAAFLDQALDGAAVSAALESVAAEVSPPGNAADIEFEFRQANGELLIKAQCGGRRSEVVCPLAA